MISKPIFIVTIFTALNLVVSFLNQVVLAYLFGASAKMDALLAAGALPLAILALAIGDLGYVLIPLLMQYKDNREELQVLINRLFSFLGLACLLFTFLGLVGHRWLLRATTAPDMPAVTFNLAVSIAPIIWLIVGLSFINSFLVGTYHFHRRFAVPTMTLIFPYLGMITAGLLWASSIGIRSVALGWLAGTLLRTLVLFLGLRGDARLRFRWGFRHPGIRALCASLVPLGVSLLPFTLLPVIDVYWASRLPEGSISYLGYCTRIVIAIALVVVQGISVVLFPDLSEDMAKRRFDEFQSKISNAITNILLLMIPLAVVIAILRVPLLEILFQRGGFDRTDTLGVAQVLPWYLLGMVWMAPMNMVSRGFYALRDYKTPAKLGLISLIIYVVLSGILIRYFSYVGIGVAYAIYWPFTFLLQIHFLGSAVGKLLNKEFLIFLSKVLGSSVLAGLLVGSISGWLNTSLGQLAGIMVAGLSGLGLFALLGYFIFRIPQFRILIADVMER